MRTDMPMLPNLMNADNPVVYLDFAIGLEKGNKTET